MRRWRRRTERESAVLDVMRGRFDHVSAERVLSGPGLVNLYNSLAALDGVPAAAYTAAQITDPETGARTLCAMRRPRCSARCSVRLPAISR